MMRGPSHPRDQAPKLSAKRIAQSQVIISFALPLTLLAFVFSGAVRADGRGAHSNPNIAEELKAGKQLGDTTYKVHLDGYNQMDLITGKGPSARHEIYYFTESTLSAVRIDDYKYRFTDQPNGWLGATEKVDWPILVNLRLDPFERTGMYNGKDNGSIAYYNWFAYQFWRFQFVQQEVAKLAKTAIDFPPMQKGASFNLEAVKAQIQRAIGAQHGN
jgi:hypothetical protein